MTCGSPILNDVREHHVGMQPTVKFIRTIHEYCIADLALRGDVSNVKFTGTRHVLTEITYVV